MASSHRLCFVLIGTACLMPLSAERSHAADRPPAPEESARGSKSLKPAPPNDDLSLVTDSKADKKLEAAEALIKEKAWAEAVAILQSLLEAPEDMFIPRRQKGEDGKETVHFASLRREAEHLVGSMPPPALEFYDAKYGPKAKALVEESKRRTDPKLLSEAAQRYFQTEPGAQATSLLGTYYLDRGDDVAAALAFERLLGHRAADLTPLTLYKATLAFRRAGDNANAEKTWKELRAQAGKESQRLWPGKRAGSSSTPPTAKSCATPPRRFSCLSPAGRLLQALQCRV